MAITAFPVRHLIRGEVNLGRPRWLPKRSAVNAQGLASFYHSKLSRRKEEPNPTQMAAIKIELQDLLEL